MIRKENIRLLNELNLEYIIWGKIKAAKRGKRGCNYKAKVLDKKPCL